MGKRRVTQKIRERMIADRERGLTLKAIADRYGVSESAVHRHISYGATSGRDLHIPPSFEDEWDEARGRILGYRIGWAEEWNEARQRILKGV